MAGKESSWEGSCACGAITYTIEDAQMDSVAICHCKLCQAWSGGVYLYAESKCVKVDDEGNKRSKWMSSEYCERVFCSVCGSNLYCRLLMDGPMNGIYHVAAGTLKDWKALQFNKEIFIDRKPKAYDMQAAGGKATSQMTMNECYKLWGVPVEDEEEIHDETSTKKQKVEKNDG